MERMPSPADVDEAGDGTVRPLSPIPGHDLSGIIGEHAPMVRGACRRVLVASGAGDEVEDAVQETFIALSERLAGSDGPPDCVGAWLHDVAVHKSLSRLRERRNRRRREQAVARLVPRSAGGDADPGDEGVLDACLAELSDAERDLIVRIFYAGESQAEIASAGGVSRVAVHKRLQRTLGRLRQSMGRRGVRIGAPALLLLLADGDRRLAAMAAGPARGAATAPVAAVAAAAALVACLWWGLAAPAAAAAPAPAAATPAPAAEPPSALAGPAVGQADPDPGPEARVRSDLEGHGDQRGMRSGDDPLGRRVPLRFEQALGGRPLVPLDSFRAATVNMMLGSEAAIVPVSSCPGIQVRRLQPGDQVVLEILAPFGQQIGLMPADRGVDPGIEMAFVYQEEASPGTWRWRTILSRCVRDGQAWLSEMTLLASDADQPRRRFWRRMNVGRDYCLTFPNPAVVHLAASTVLSQASCRMVLDACLDPEGDVLLDP